MSNGTSTVPTSNWMSSLQNVAPVGTAAPVSSGAPQQSSSLWDSIGGLAGIGGILGGVGGLAGISVPFIQDYLNKNAQARTERHKWQAMKPKAEELYEMLVYAPWMEGRLMPYNTDYSKSKRNWYEYAPTEAMGGFYQNALSRSYGMPTGVARAMSTQAMSQLRNPGLVAAMNPLQAGAATRIDPARTAQTMLGKQQIGMLEQRNLMQNAQRLAEYNMWRAGKVKELIG